MKLIKAEIKDAELIWQMQKQAFMPLLEKYRDMETNPANEPFEKVVQRLQQPNSHFYLIWAEGAVVGAIRIIDAGDNLTKKKISPLFVMPQYRNRGVAQWAIGEAERIFGRENWELATILQEKGNCYLYEKMGYKASGRTQAINDRLTLCFYEK